MSRPTANRIEWNTTVVDARLLAYVGKVQEALVKIAKYFEPVLEAYAKANAPWTDRTANARQGLRAYIGTDAPAGYPSSQQLAKDVVELFLSHGMYYGIFLETRFAGQFAIIYPTLQQHAPDVQRMLREVFRV
jgi:hypothetical protein